MKKSDLRPQYIEEFMEIVLKTKDEVSNKPIKDKGNKKFISIIFIAIGISFVVKNFGNKENP